MEDSEAGYQERISPVAMNIYAIRRNGVRRIVAAFGSSARRLIA